VRTAPSLTALGGPGFDDRARQFAGEVAAVCAPFGVETLAIERLDLPLTSAVQSAMSNVVSATPLFVEARRIKLPGEVAIMRDAMERVDRALETMLDHLQSGATEVEVWSHFQQRLIELGGEYVSTRLVQAGARTFPYFREAGPGVLSNGDLFCIDTDAIGLGGYAVDFSRTYSVGGTPTAQQRELHALAVAQVEHNAQLLEPGRPFEEGMVICLESYIGDEEQHQGVKIENQYLVTDSGAQLMSCAPYDPSFSG